MWKNDITRYYNMKYKVCIKIYIKLRNYIKLEREDLYGEYSINCN